MVNFACAQKVPNSTKLRLIKGQKTKFLCGSMPPNPLVCPMLSTQIRTWAKSWKKPWLCTMVTLKVWGHGKNALCCMYLTDNKKNQTAIELQLMVFQLQCKCSVCQLCTGAHVLYTYCSTTPEKTKRQTDRKMAMFVDCYNAACCLLIKIYHKTE